MNDKQTQTEERISRQTGIDAEYVEPAWERNVDRPLVDMALAGVDAPNPAVLLPELHFRTLLGATADALAGSGKVMVVDDSGVRFDAFRSHLGDRASGYFFSTQDAATLNYADDIFHAVATSLGIRSLTRAGELLASYRRVLRPGARIAFSAPLTGSFPAFFDMLDESLVALCPSNRAAIMDDVAEAMRPDTVRRRIADAGLELEIRSTASLRLEFPAADVLLFSTLMESHFLGYCLQLRGLDANALLRHVVRSFRRYFQGESIAVPLEIGLFAARKKEP